MISFMQELFFLQTQCCTICVLQHSCNICSCLMVLKNYLLGGEPHNHVNNNAKLTWKILLMENSWHEGNNNQSNRPTA